MGPRAHRGPNFRHRGLVEVKHKGLGDERDYSCATTALTPHKSRNVCTCLTLFDPLPRIDGDENRVRDEGIRVVTVRHCDNHHFTVVPTV